jgi:cytochrome c-type biogenesis protein CcmF
VLLGTLYPLLLEALTGDKISVGPPFFNLTFGPLMIPLLLAVPFGPILAWKRGNLGMALERLWWAGAAALVVVASIFALFGIMPGSRPSPSALPSGSCSAPLPIRWAA